jgi:uncharacterized cupredoxin-like copper-binding protein
VDSGEAALGVGARVCSGRARARGPPHRGPPSRAHAQRHPRERATRGFQGPAGRGRCAAGTVRFRILNHGPTSHELIVVRTDRAPEELPLQRDGLTVNEDAPDIDLVDEAEGLLDIDDRQTLVLDLAAGNYVLYCNLEGHYLGGMNAALTVR